MYAVVAIYKLESGHYDEMHTIATDAPSKLKELKGFLSAVFYSDSDQNEFGATTIWENKESYQSYIDSVPDVVEKIMAWSREPAEVKIYDVNNYYSV